MDSNYKKNKDSRTLPTKRFRRMQPLEEMRPQITMEIGGKGGLQNVITEGAALSTIDQHKQYQHC